MNCKPFFTRNSMNGYFNTTPTSNYSYYWYQGLSALSKLNLIWFSFHGCILLVLEAPTVKLTKPSSVISCGQFISDETQTCIIIIPCLVQSLTIIVPIETDSGSTLPPEEKQCGWKKLARNITNLKYIQYYTALKPYNQISQVLLVEIQTKYVRK